jgi:hypothetical protein
MRENLGNALKIMGLCDEDRILFDKRRMLHIEWFKCF